MKKFSAILFAVLFAVSGAFAHGVLLLVQDNGDGTIFIEAGLSTGGSAVGADVILKEKSSGKVISTQKYPEEGTLNVKQPTVPYTVTVYLGEGHEVTKNGPLTKAKSNDKKDNKAVEKDGMHSHDGGKTYHKVH